MSRRSKEQARLVRSTHRFRHRFYVLYFGFLSYLVICLILSCCNLFLYSAFNRTSRQYVETSYQDTLSRNMLQFDNKISSSYGFYRNLASNETVNQVLRGELRLEPGAAAAFSFAGTLTKLLASSDYEGIYIYFRESGLVASNFLTAPAEEFYQYYYAGSELSFPDWLRRMQSPSLAAQLPVTLKDGSRCLDLLYQLPAHVAGGYVRATMVVRMKESVFRNLTYSKNRMGSTVILNRENRIIMSDANSLPPLKSFEEYQGDTVMEDGDTVSVCATSANTGWKFIYIVDNQAFYRSMKRASALQLTFLILSLLLCCALGVWFTYKNYAPLSELIAIYDRQGDQADDRPYDYRAVKDALNDYVLSKRNLNIMENKLRQPYITNYLTGLLQGTDVKREPELVAFPSDYFTVIAFRPYNNQNLFGEDDKVNREEAEDMTFLIIQNIFEELFNKTDTCKIIRHGGEITGICCYRDEQSALIYKTGMHTAITYGMSVIRSNFQFGCDVGISSVKQGLKNIQAAYSEANLALGYRAVNAESVLFYDEIYRPNVKTERFFSNAFAEYQKELMACISSRDRDGALRSLDTIFKRCIQSLSIEKAKVALLRLTSSILSFYDLNQESAEAEFPADILSALDFNSPAKVLEYLRKLVERLCDVPEEAEPAAPAPSQNGESLLPKIIDYIRENYNDNNMNLNTVSSYFGFSSYYVSKLFKGSTGETVVEYIAQLRIEKAKRLLETTDLSITEIYKQCGFVSEKTFFRTFSKYASVTPGKYRSMNQAPPL